MPKPSKRQQAAWDELAKTDPHAAEVASLGGHLAQPTFPSKKQWDSEVARYASYAPGCGASTHVDGTNGGTMPCGAKLDGKTYLCAMCALDQRVESMPKRAKSLIQEAPIDTGDYGDFIDPSHKRRIAAHRSPGMPDRHAEVLASTSYQEAVRKLARYTGITPRNQRDLMQVSGMMMQALQTVSQIEQGHEQELEQAAVNLVLSLPEFKAAKDAFDAGEIRVRAELTANIDLNAARVDAEDTTDREELKIAQVAQELDLEVQKRKLINMMIQGNAMNKMQAYHMAQEQLDAVDPRLMNLYGVLTSVGEFSYWMFPEAMQKQSMEQRGGAGGASHVRRGEDGVPEIVAQGITFPMLVHELVKALMEYVSYNEDDESDTRSYVSGQADTLDNELMDIKIGPAAWRNIVAMIRDQELVPYVYEKLVSLPAGQFNTTMRTLLSGGPQAQRIIDQIVAEVSDQRNQEESVSDVVVRNLID